MKKFKFALEPLLRVRKIHENIALTGLAKVMVHVNRVEGEKVESKKMISQEMDLFSRRRVSEISIEDYHMYNRYLDRLDAQISKADRTLETLKPDVEREQQKVVEARRKKRIVEILKERKKEAYDYSFKKKEKKDLAELKLIAGEDGIKRRHTISEKYPEKKSIEAYDHDVEEEFESFDFEGERTGRTEEGDVISEYFKKYGMEDPRKKK